MKVKDVIYAVGRSGYMHRDLMAIKGGAKQDGFIFHGKPVSPGFRRIAEPATIISVMLVLDDGQIAFGDCADVILAGVAGRDPAFHAEDHIDYMRREIADVLRGRDVAKFRAHAEEMDRHTRGGKPLHTAIRYGITQALLHATALAGKLTMTEVIAREYGTKIAAAADGLSGLA
jgi:methylaspartate ammonia-lyase